MLHTSCHTATVVQRGISRVVRHTGAASCPDTSQPMVLERRRRAETNRIHRVFPPWLTALSWRGVMGGGGG